MCVCVCVLGGGGGGLVVVYFGCISAGNLYLFLAMPWIGLQYVIVVYVCPGHTHLLLGCLLHLALFQRNPCYRYHRCGV